MNIIAIEVFNRMEHKYLISADTFEKILPVIEQHMNKDKYNLGGNTYTIANLYYDTADNALIRHSLSSPDYKEKLRMRCYEIPDKDTTVYLEIKKKCRGLVNKRRTAMRLTEAEAFIRTALMPPPRPEMNAQVMAEIFYMLQVYPLMPKVFLAYDRYAFFDKGNSDLRISFDKNIRSRRVHTSPAEGFYGEPLLDENVYLMEIKTALSKPLWLTNLLCAHSIRRVSFSKYGTEYTKYITKNGGLPYEYVI